jgi:putative NADH-flavin reductase
MDAHGIKKLAVISAVPAGPRAEQPFVQRRIIIPVLQRIFGATYADMRRMEALLRGSDLDWVCLRPPRLVGKKATGRYRLDASRPLPHARSITCADLATALLDSLTRPDLYRRAAYVAN